MTDFQKGSVTIYLSFTLTIILSLLLVLLEGARRNAISVEADCAMDLAVYSVFAEYNKALFDRYHLLFVDTSYGKEKDSTEELKAHLDAFIRMNLSEDTSVIRQVDFTKTFLETSQIDGLSYATDEEAAVFERQAVLFMKQKYGIAYVEQIKKEMEKAEKLQLFTRDVSAQREANQALIDEEKEKGRETGQVDEEGNPITEPFELENPADAVNGIRPSGVLLLVTDSEAMISSKTVQISQCYSQNTTPDKGQGLAGRDAIGVSEGLLFLSYIKEVCGCYTTQRQEGALTYQMEYLVAGKESDEENLKNVVHRLLLLREVSNVTYLFSDAAKQAEAGTLATSICSAAGVPYLIEPVKLSLLFAWAYAESVFDVRMLLKGKRVPLIKEAKDWHSSLAGMLHYASDQALESGGESLADAKEQGIQAGLSYEDYLMLLILSKSRKERVGRMIDLIELDVRQKKGNESFKMQFCVDAMSCRSFIGSRFGYSFEVERTFCYQ